MMLPAARRRSAHLGFYQVMKSFLLSSNHHANPKLIKLARSSPSGSRLNSNSSWTDQGRAQQSQRPTSSLESLLANSLCKSNLLPPSIPLSIQESLMLPSIQSPSSRTSDLEGDPSKISIIISSLKSSPISFLLSHSHPLRAIAHFKSILTPLLQDPSTLSSVSRQEATSFKKVLKEQVQLLGSIIQFHPDRPPQTLSKATKHRLRVRNGERSRPCTSTSTSSSTSLTRSSNPRQIWHPSILPPNVSPLHLSPKVQNLLALTFIIDTWFQLATISRDLNLSNFRRIRPEGSSLNLVLNLLASNLKDQETLLEIAEKIFQELKTEAEVSGEMLEEYLVRLPQRSKKNQSQVQEKPHREIMFSRGNLTSLIIAFGSAGNPNRGIQILQEWSQYYSTSGKPSKEILEDDGVGKVDGINLQGWSDDNVIWSSLIQSHILGNDLRGASVWLERYRGSLSILRSSTSNDDGTLRSDFSSSHVPPEKSHKPYLTFLAGCIRLLPKGLKDKAIEEGKNVMRLDGIEFGSQVLSFFNKYEADHGRAWKTNENDEREIWEEKIMEKTNERFERSVEVNPSRSDAEFQKEKIDLKNRIQIPLIGEVVSKDLNTDLFSRIFIQQLLRTKSQSFSHSPSVDEGPNPISSIDSFHQNHQFNPITKLPEVIKPFLESPRSTLSLLFYFHHASNGPRRTLFNPNHLITSTSKHNHQTISPDLLHLALEALIYGNLAHFQPFNSSSSNRPSLRKEIDLPGVLLLLQSFKFFGLEPDEVTHRLGLACTLKVGRIRIGMEAWKRKALNTVEEGQAEEIEEIVQPKNGVAIDRILEASPSSNDSSSSVSTEGKFAGKTSHSDVLHFSSKPSIRGIRDLNYLIQSLEIGVQFELRAANALIKFQDSNGNLKDLDDEVQGDLEASNCLRGGREPARWALDLLRREVKEDEREENFEIEVEREGSRMDLEKCIKREDGDGLLRLVMRDLKDEVLPRMDQLKRGGKGRIRLKRR